LKEFFDTCMTDKSKVVGVNKRETESDTSQWGFYVVLGVYGIVVNDGISRNISMIIVPIKTPCELHELLYSVNVAKRSLTDLSA
jgi:hypothetical protein